MLADPQSLTINAVANSLPRTTSSTNEGVFNTADGNLRLRVQHSFGKRTRHLVRVDYTKVAPDPLAAAQNLQYSMSAQFVADLPKVGFTVTEANYICQALFKLLTDTSGATTIKVLGGES